MKSSHEALEKQVWFFFLHHRQVRAWMAAPAASAAFLDINKVSSIFRGRFLPFHFNWSSLIVIGVVSHGNFSPTGSPTSITSLLLDSVARNYNTWAWSFAWKWYVLSQGIIYLHHHHYLGLLLLHATWKMTCHLCINEPRLATDYRRAKN